MVNQNLAFEHHFTKTENPFFNFERFINMKIIDIIKNNVNIFFMQLIKKFPGNFW